VGPAVENLVGGLDCQGGVGAPLNHATCHEGDVGGPLNYAACHGVVESGVVAPGLSGPDSKLELRKTSCRSPRLEQPRRIDSSS